VPELSGVPLGDHEALVVVVALQAEVAVPSVRGFEKTMKHRQPVRGHREVFDSDVRGCDPCCCEQLTALDWEHELDVGNSMVVAIVVVVALRVVVVVSCTL